ncbi:transcriptional regulator antitoxin [Candidatus Mancarchaeum acidiphilum]|uniref:Transcriptional regulator antitoxin n=1 Tax=Candidatus Mancarchaeum acidiphilum TaxID=1920749 RepID=A0A218NMT3_9ARCH|nr:hypothetical protein [Candidatus Mancarchaeum acidiphilum]ASI13785.1 transcriptional regulator antitoxin [Candidatus Mancarchaeum acidiphilum]
MNQLQFIKEIKSLNIPVFSTKEASMIVNKDIKYTSLYLSRLLNRGEISRIEKGKYYLKDANPYAVASNIIYPSYVSMMSAFKYYGITTQNLSAIDILTDARHSNGISIGGYNIIFTKIPRRLMFGFYRSKEDGTFVAYVEKAIIDAILIGNLPIPYIEEAYENAKESRILEKGRLSSYIKRIGSKDLKEKINKIEKEVKEIKFRS